MVTDRLGNVKDQNFIQNCGQINLPTPWFSNSGFGVEVLEVDKDLILYYKDSI